MAILSVRLLGGFNLALDGEPLLTVKAARLQSLFAYLLLHRDSPISRPRLAFLFWPDCSEAQAHSNLRKLLHTLRSLLPGADTLLIADTHTIAWNPDAPPGLDVDGFEYHASQAGSIADLQQAVELYGGDLLPACYDEWVLPERERLRQTYLGALERVVRLLEEQGDYRAAIAYARKQLQSDPLSEETYRELMRLSALSGNRAQVVWFYRTCTTVLQREMGVEPSAETQHTYAHCLDLAAQATAHPPRPVTSVTAPGSARPHNLPFQMTSLVGRVRERQEIGRLLTDNRLLTLVGPPGVGKTRLAIQVATDLLVRFSSGAWFVELAPLRDPGLVVPTIARVLGLAETGETPILETLKQYLHEKGILLVLDNFEHLPGAAGDVFELLAACPHAQALVTSRVPLRLSGEHEYPVHPLPLPARDPSGYLPGRGELGQCEAVRLFVEWAQAVLPNFELTNDNARSVAEICIRLDGLPLAIELAAARIRMFSPQALLGRLEYSLQLLRGGPRGLPERHRTLRSAIDWSYSLLSEMEQQLFRRMAVFNGGRTLEALEDVCNFDGKLQTGVLDGVEALVEQSLLEQREGRNPEPRFWMLETIQEFAGEKLRESGEEDALRRRHARHFLALAEEAKAQLTGPEQQEWLDRLDDEHDNLRAALQWARGEAGGESDEAEGVEMGLRAATDLFWFWVLRGYYSEGREHLCDLLARAAHLPACSKESQVKALNIASNLERMQGDVSAARPLAEHALTLSRETEDRVAIADALNNLANLEQDPGVARALYEESLAIKRELGDKAGIGGCLNNLGILAVLQGDYGAAWILYEESLEISRELGNRALVSWRLFNMGALALEQGDFSRAGALFKQSLRTFEEMGDRDSVCMAMGFLGHLALEEGDCDRARTLYTEALRMGREMGLKMHIGVALIGMANLATLQGDYPSASTLCEEVAEVEGEQGEQVLSLTYSGIAARQRGENQMAYSLFHKAVTLDADGHFKKRLFESLAFLGGTLVDMGQVERGVKLLGAVDGLVNRLGATLCLACRMQYERAREEALSRLGCEQFQKAWEEGEAMSMEQAVEYAVERHPLVAGMAG